VKDAGAPLVTSLANDLAAHMVIEDEIVYPKVTSVEPDLVVES
jgi:iron-sulfur cluster repair protein YtfE (RIC family)